MSIEYNIRYMPRSTSEWAAFVARLENPVENDWPAFKVELTERGVYFCDYGHRSPRLSRFAASSTRR